MHKALIRVILGAHPAAVPIRVQPIGPCDCRGDGRPLAAPAGEASLYGNMHVSLDAFGSDDTGARCRQRDGQGVSQSHETGHGDAGPDAGRISGGADPSAFSVGMVHRFGVGTFQNGRTPMGPSGPVYFWNGWGPDGLTSYQRWLVKRAIH